MEDSYSSLRWYPPLHGAQSIWTVVSWRISNHLLIHWLAHFLNSFGLNTHWLGPGFVYLQWTTSKGEPSRVGRGEVDAWEPTKAVILTPFTAFFTHMGTTGGANAMLHKSNFTCSYFEYHFFPGPFSRHFFFGLWYGPSQNSHKLQWLDDIFVLIC